MKSKSELWWVSVGGHPCEPARVVRLTDKEFDELTVFTIGCPDGTVLNGQSGIELVEKLGPAPKTPFEAEKARKAWERKKARDEKQGIYHGYRSFE